MKLVCAQRALAEGLAVVERAVPSKSPLPVLSNILLVTDDGRLKLVANNLEMAISAWVGAEVADEGAVTLPARLLSDFVSTLVGGDVQMELKPGTKTMQLKCGRYEANINGIDAEDFPAVPSVGDGPRVPCAPQDAPHGHQPGCVRRRNGRNAPRPVRRAGHHRRRPADDGSGRRFPPRGSDRPAGRARADREAQLLVPGAHAHRARPHHRRHRRSGRDRRHAEPQPGDVPVSGRCSSSHG